MIENEKLRFRSRSFPGKKGTFAILQEYSARSYLFFFSFWAAGIYVLMANHKDLFWFGIGGIFAVMVLANIAGMVRSKMQFVEIGFNGAFFYLVSVYDIAFNEEISYYPSAFANLQQDGPFLFLNYKGQMIRLKKEDWEHWHDLQSAFFMSAASGEQEQQPL